MADYGHDLVFGTFLTPQNADPHAPVALARLSEQAGLDLVTFQDHPYQPAFLDTWTLLSYVAAQTAKVKLSGNVINPRFGCPRTLPSKQPALTSLSTARSSSGREAAPSWKPTGRMAAPTRTPPEPAEPLT